MSLSANIDPQNGLSAENWAGNCYILLFRTFSMYCSNQNLVMMYHFYEVRLQVYIQTL